MRKLNLVAKASTLREAKAEGGFRWARGAVGWNDDTLVGEVYQQLTKEEGGPGTTGLPGVIETDAEYARLFAAAPELLEACQHLATQLNGLVTALENVGPNWKCDPMQQLALNMAERAIKKAAGEKMPK